jgi:hypothetical protein
MQWWKAVGKWAEARAVGNAHALSTASGPVRAQPGLSTCPQPRATAIFVVGAPNPIGL